MSAKVANHHTSGDAYQQLLTDALQIAVQAYPKLKISDYLHQIDVWGDELKQGLQDDDSVQTRLIHLNRFLFQDKGFSGQTKDYYDPRNSYLNEVIDRRIGIPLTLSLLYMSLGQRIELPLVGVSFPGHFLVKLDVSNGMIVLDPFNGGISLDEEELQQLLEPFQNDPLPGLADLLKPATHHDIILRMLRNLFQIYQHNDDKPALLKTINLMIEANDPHPQLYRERGKVLAALDCGSSAIANFEQYLKRVPNAADAEQYREKIIDLNKQFRYLH